MPSFQTLNNALFGRANNDSVGVQQQEITDARKGIYYFLGHTQLVHTPSSFSFLLSASTGILTAPTVVYDALSLPDLGKNYAPVGKSIFGAGIRASHTAQKVDTEISQFFACALQKLASVFGPLNMEVTNFLKSISFWSLGGYLGYLMSNSIPCWGQVNLATSAYSSIRQVISHGYNFLSQAWSSRGVQLLGGHPDIIATALARHSLTYVAKGTRDAVLCYAAGAITTVSGPAGPFASTLFYGNGANLSASLTK